MAEFATFIPDAFVSRVFDPISSWCTKNENHPIVTKLLTYYSAANVAALTNAERAAVFAAVQIWQETQQDEVESAVSTAASTARQSAIDDFIP